jgi:hypothetical protein
MNPTTILSVLSDILSRRYGNTITLKGVEKNGDMPIQSSLLHEGEEFIWP